MRGALFAIALCLHWALCCAASEAAGPSVLVRLRGATAVAHARPVSVACPNVCGNSSDHSAHPALAIVALEVSDCAIDVVKLLLGAEAVLLPIGGTMCAPVLAAIASTRSVTIVGVDGAGDADAAGRRVAATRPDVCVIELPASFTRDALLRVRKQGQRWGMGQFVPGACCLSPAVPEPTEQPVMVDEQRCTVRPDGQADCSANPPTWPSEQPVQRSPLCRPDVRAGVLHVTFPAGAFLAPLPLLPTSAGGLLPLVSGDLPNAQLTFASPATACRLVANTHAVRGRWALVEAGGCSVKDKAATLARAGAVGALVPDAAAPCELEELRDSAVGEAESDGDLPSTGSELVEFSADAALTHALAYSAQPPPRARNGSNPVTNGTDPSFAAVPVLAVCPHAAIQIRAMLGPVLTADVRLEGLGGDMLALPAGSGGGRAPAPGQRARD